MHIKHYYIKKRIVVKKTLLAAYLFIVRPEINKLYLIA